MKKRYNVIRENKEYSASENSPALMIANSLINDRFTGNYIAILKFMVTEPVNIVDFTIDIHCKDSAGRYYDSPVSYTYVQLQKCRDELFGADIAIILGDLPVTDFSVEFSEAVCSERTFKKAESSDNLFIKIDSPETLEDYFHDSELSKQFTINYGNDCKFYPVSTGRYWYCACGAVNNNRDNSCHCCKRSFAALSRISTSSLKADAAIRIKDEEAEAEALKAEKEEKRKAFRKFVPIIIPVLVVAVLLAAFVPVLVRKEKAYVNAQQLLEQNLFEEAQQAFSQLGNYRNSADFLNNEIEYRKALYIIDCADKEDYSILSLTDFNKDDFAETYIMKQAVYSYSADILSGLPESYHNDISSKIEHCEDMIESINTEHLQGIYNTGCAALENREYSEAYKTFGLISDFKDSAELQREAMYQRACAAYSIISSYRCEGVYADFSGISGSNVVISLSKNTAFRLGDRFLSDVRKTFENEGLELNMSDSEPDGLLELCTVVFNEFKTIGSYKDSDDYSSLCLVASDYTLEFRQLVSEGRLQEAKEWLEMYDGKFDNREEWFTKLDTYIPFCADFYFISGDNTLLPLTQDINTSVNNIKAFVVIKDDVDELHIVNDDIDLHVIMTVKPDELKFYYSTEYSTYLCCFTVIGRLGYLRYSTDGNLIGSAEYYYS